MKLYEVNQAILDALDRLEFDPETGEIGDNTDEVMKELDSLQMEKHRILVYLAKVALNNRAESSALKDEEKRLKDRRERLDRKTERIIHILDRECGEKTDLDIATLSYRKTSSLIVDDNAKAVRWLKRHKYKDCFTKPEPEVSKNPVKQLIGSGVEVPGCHIKTDNSCSLK